MESIVIKYGDRFNFFIGRQFQFHPRTNTIEYPVGVPDSELHQLKLLHEISHAILGHSLSLGLDRTTMERDADSLAMELLIAR